MILALPAAAHYVLLTLRAPIPLAHALGYPWLYMRYAMPALPLLGVLALTALARRSFSWRHALVAAAVAVPVWIVLVTDPDDFLFLRRLAILRLTLLLALVATVALWLARRRGVLRAKVEQFGHVVAAGAIGMGIAITCGIDVRAVYEVRVRNDAHVDRIAKITPQRFALVGYAAEIDIPLTLHATRDIETADLLEAKDWNNFHALIDRWTAEKRPIYALLYPNPNGSKTWTSPWADVVFEPVDAPNHVYLVRKVEPPR
jgi:hypothetical protein